MVLILMVNKLLISVIVHALICDVPAKSFALCTKGHSDYFSCSKCVIKGSYINGRVCFPLVEDTFNCLRTDLKFLKYNWIFW
jgi:hypothetical protein